MVWSAGQARVRTRGGLGGEGWEVQRCGRGGGGGVRLCMIRASQDDGGGRAYLLCGQLYAEGPSSQGDTQPSLACWRPHRQRAHPPTPVLGG